VAGAVLAGGGTLAGRLAVGRLTSAWREDLHLVATLREGAARPEAAEGLVGAVRALPGVAEVRYVSPEEALGELRRRLTGIGDGLDRLAANPVPARLEIVPALTLDATGLRELVSAVARDPRVDDVTGAFDWVAPAERADRALRLGGTAVTAALALAALGAIAVSATAVRRSRAEETAICRIAGVSEARLWSPVLTLGVLEGLLGAVLGVVSLWLASESGAPWLGGWLHWLGLGPIPALPPAMLRGSLGGGALLGLAGSLLGGRP